MWTTDQYGNSVRVSDAILAATASDSGVVIHRNADWRRELAEYNKERDIRSLMMNRTGVCG